MKSASKSTVTAALSTFALAAVLSASVHAGPVAQPSGSEKCYGVSKAGKNDCAAGAHSCAGQSTKNLDKASFVYLPAGACEKLASGSTTPGK